MAKFAVHFEDSNGRRSRVIEEAATPELASNNVRARYSDEHGSAIIRKVKIANKQSSKGTAHAT